MWKHINYGPLRKKAIYQRAQSLYHKNNINLAFWRKVLSGEYSFGVRKETLNGIFTAKFYIPAVQTKDFVLVEFHSVDDLLEKMSDTGLEFEAGYDFDMLWKADPKKEHFYLDMSSQDDCKRKPRPSHIKELKENDGSSYEDASGNKMFKPDWSHVPLTRKLAQQKFLQQHELEYYEECHNTFEVHGMDISEDTQDSAEMKILELQREKYKLLTEAHDLGHYHCRDTSFKRMLVYQILEEFEADSDGVVQDMFVRFNYSELLMMGCHNSSKGGMGYAAKKGETKTTTAVLATLEACSMFKQAAERGQCTIRPHTMNCKEERNKPGKKEKMFIQLDHCMQIINYLFYGSGTDKSRQYVQGGYLMGASLNGQVIDELLRIQLGLASGQGKLGDGQLKALNMIETDFGGFEIHPDKNVFLIVAWCKMMVYGGGVMDSAGHPSPMLKVVHATNFERKLLPDVRCGGNNTCWMSPGIQISGEPDTLVNNQKNHKGMVLMAQYEHEAWLMENRPEQAYLPENTPKMEGAPKNGDDGMYHQEPYVENILKELETHEPVKFKQEKKGAFLADIRDAELVNQAVSFCKSHFVLEAIDGREVITLQRIFQNMHKCVRGNRSTVDPKINMNSVISQTQNVYGNDRFYRLLEFIYRQLGKIYFNDENPKVAPTDFRDQTAIDSNYHFDYFPTQAEVRSVLYNRDIYKIAELQRSLRRHYQYGVPATGVGKY